MPTVAPETGAGSLAMILDPQIFAKMVIELIVELASAVSLVDRNVGSAIADRIPSTNMQTRSSTSVKPVSDLFGLILSGRESVPGLLLLL